MRFLAGSLAFVILCQSPAYAQAKIDFSAYEGPPQVQVGTGGTRIVKNGIDYWTSGTPPRRYQVIGMVQDRRDETWDGGHAIGSPSIAAKVRKAGGDAVAAGLNVVLLIDDGHILVDYMYNEPVQRTW